MLEDALAIFSTVLGHCYVATIAPGLEDKHCWSPVYDRAHVRDVHVVSKDGKPVYQGEAIYSATPDGLVFVYVNGEGGSGTGRASVEDGTMRFAMDMRGSASGALQNFKGTWKPTGNGYVQTNDGEDPRVFELTR